MGTDQIMSRLNNEKMPVKVPSEEFGADKELKEQWRAWIKNNYPVGLSYDLSNEVYLNELVKFLWEKAQHQEETFFDAIAAADEDSEMQKSFSENALHFEGATLNGGSYSAQIKLDNYHTQDSQSG